MDIILLPEEMSEYIFFYLNLSDILSCCLVNTSWRNGLNNNRIWSYWCSKKFGIEKSNSDLNTSQNRVAPGFTVPQNTSYWLTDVCKWRIRFMQEVHISKNWRNRRYHTEFVTYLNLGEILESDGNVIILPNTANRTFTPLSITDTVSVRRTVPFALHTMLASFFKLDNNKLVIAQCTLLQVFVKTENNDFVLQYRFLYDEPIEASRSIPDAPVITDWYAANVNVFPCDISMVCDHDGKYFVGVILEGDLNTAIMHVWDISNGIKCGAQGLPQFNNYYISDIRFCIHNSKIFLFLKIIADNINCTQINCFNLDTLTYTNLNLRFDYILPIVQVRDPYLFVADSTGFNIFIWTIADGKLIHKLCSEYYLNPMTVQFASSFVFICGNSADSDMVTVFNTKTLQTTQVIFTGFIVIHVMLIRSELMLIRGSRQGGIWDIVTGTKLYAIERDMLCRHLVWTNRNFSKIAMESENDELFLIHFW